MKHTAISLFLFSATNAVLFGVESPIQADAHTASTGSSRNLNAGTAQRLIVTPLHKTFLRFDLTVLSPNINRTDIARATVRLYASRVTAPGLFDVFEVTSPWDESQIKGTFAPTLAASPEKTGIAVSSAGRFVIFDITEQVRDWVSNAAANNGIALVSNATGIGALFDSKENAVTSHAPILEITLAHGGIPGAITAFGGATTPAGWLVCDGSQILRADYPDLFAAVGTAWGAGNSSTTFNLPDLRGRFLRGVDGNAGRDPDVSSRSAANGGGNVGNNVGSVQGDQFKAHWPAPRKLIQAL